MTLWSCPTKLEPPVLGIVAKAASVYDGERCCGPSLLPGAILSCLARGRRASISEGKRRSLLTGNGVLSGRQEGPIRALGSVFPQSELAVPIYFMIYET